MDCGGLLKESISAGSYFGLYEDVKTAVRIITPDGIYFQQNDILQFYSLEPHHRNMA